MKEPAFFPDEIAERLRNLRHGDEVVVRNGSEEERYRCYQNMGNDNGILWTRSRFVTNDGAFIRNIVEKLYDAYESGASLFVIITNELQPF